MRFKKLVDTNSYSISVSIDDETKYYLSQAYSELKYYLETIPNKLSISLIEGLSYINQNDLNDLRNHLINTTFSIRRILNIDIDANNICILISFRSSNYIIERILKKMYNENGCVPQYDLCLSIGRINKTHIFKIRKFMNTIFYENRPFKINSDDLYIFQYNNNDYETFAIRDIPTRNKIYRPVVSQVPVPVYFPNPQAKEFVNTNYFLPINTISQSETNLQTEQPMFSPVSIVSNSSSSFNNTPNSSFIEEPAFSPVTHISNNIFTSNNI